MFILSQTGGGKSAYSQRTHSIARENILYLVNYCSYSLKQAAESQLIYFYMVKTNNMFLYGKNYLVKIPCKLLFILSQTGGGKSAYSQRTHSIARENILYLVNYCSYSLKQAAESQLMYFYMVKTNNMFLYGTIVYKVFFQLMYFIW